MPDCPFLRRIIGLLILCVGCYSPIFAQTSPNADPVPVVAVSASKTAIVEEVPVTGTVTSPQTAMLSASVNGLVQAVHVEVGDPVKADDLLITLDRELAELELHSAEAEVQEATATLKDTQRRLEDARTLMKSQGIAETDVRSLEAEADVSKAILERLQAELNRQRALLGRHQVKAPFAGVISQKLAETGEWVTPGTAVLELTATDGLRLDFQVPQEFFSRIDSRTPVQVGLSGNQTGQRYAGEIRALVPVSDPDSRTFLLRVVLPQNNIPMTPGMAAQAVLQLNRERGIAIPRDAILRHPDGRETVWVVEQDGDQLLAVERNVKTGVTFEGNVEIIDGLRAGERVVARGNEALQSGQPVKLVESNDSPS